MGGLISRCVGRFSIVNLFRFTKQHHSYDALFTETISTLFYGVGNLKDSVRHFIAIMVSLNFFWENEHCL